jgi:hypothetical protein
MQPLGYGWDTTRGTAHCDLHAVTTDKPSHLD